MKENRISEEDSEEEVERKKLYTKLCAHKKPYFFAYNYSHLKTEYDTFMKNARSNAISLYKKDIDTFIEEYKNGKLTDENEIKFMENFYYKLPLDMSKGTMNRICWAIEKEFDGVDVFRDVDFDYSILKSNVEYDENTFNIVKHICDSFKPSIQLAKKRSAINCDINEDDDWQSVDIITQNLVEDLYACCPNGDALCNILADLCYRDGVSKQIFWKACGDNVFERLLEKHNYNICYPKKSDNGEFECQGIKYIMVVGNMQGGDIDEGV